MWNIGIGVAQDVEFVELKCINYNRFRNSFVGYLKYSWSYSSNGYMRSNFNNQVIIKIITNYFRLKHQKIIKDMVKMILLECMYIFN